MGRLDIGWVFIKWGWDIRINSSIGWEVNSIINFLYLYAVVLSIVLFCNLLIF